MRHAARTGRRRLVWRIAGAIALAVGVLLAVALVVLGAILLYVRTNAGRERVRRLVLEQARKQVPGLEIGRVRGGLPSDVVLDDVTIRDPEGRVAVHVDEVRARLRLLALVRHEVGIERLELDGALVHSMPGRAGGSNLAELVVMPPNATPSAWTVTISRLSVRDGIVLVDGATGRKLAASGVWLGGALRTSAGLLDVDIRDLNAGIEAGDRVLHVELAGRSMVDPKSVVVTIARLSIAGALPGGPVVLAGRVSRFHERLSATLFGEIANGSIWASGSVATPSAGPIRYDAVVRVRSVDPGALDTALGHGALRAKVSVTGTGTPLATGGRARVHVALGPSRIAGYRLRSGDLFAGLRDRRWILDASTLRMDGLTAHAIGTGEGRTLDLDLDAAMDARRLPPPLSRARRGLGVMHARVLGSWPDAVTVDADAHLFDLALASGQTARSADLTVHLSGLPSAPSGSGRLIASHVELGATAPLLESVDLRGFARRGAFSVEVVAAGGQANATFAAGGRVRGRSVDATVARLDVVARGRRVRLLAPTWVTVRTGPTITLGPTQLAMLGGRVVASGGVRLGTEAMGNATVSASGVELPGVPAYFSPLAGRASVLLGARTAHVTLSARFGMGRSDARADAVVPVVTPPGATWPTVARHGRLEARVAIRGLPLEQLASFGMASDAPLRGNLGGTVGVAGDVAGPDIRAHLTLDDAALVNMSHLAATADVTLGARSSCGHLALTVRGAPLATADLTAAAGTASLRSGLPSLAAVPFEAHVAVPALPVDSLAQLSGRFVGLGGVLSADLHMSGTLGNPAGSAEVVVGGLSTRGVEIGTVHAQLRSGGGTADGRLDVTAFPSGVVHAAGSTELRPGGRLTIALLAQGLRLDFLPLLLPTLRSASGVLDARMQVNGTRDAPTIQGRLTVTGGRLGIVEQPEMRDVRLTVVFSPGHATLQSLFARSGGTLTATGQATLAGLLPSRFHLDARARRFRVAYAGVTGSKLDATVTADGAVNAASTTATVVVRDATLSIPRLSTGRQLQPIGKRPDVEFVGAKGQGVAEAKTQRVSGGGRNVDLSANVVTLYLRNKDLDLEIAGRIVGRAQDGNPLVVVGSLTVTRGFINLQGQRFNVDRASVVWSGNPAGGDEPRLNIRLTHEYPEATAIVDLTGTPSHPRLHLTSDPPTYDQSQILGMLLTGQGAGTTGESGTAGAEAMVSNLILGQIADRIAPNVGVDVFRVRSQHQVNEYGLATGQTDTRVEMGKYITPKIFLSYVHVFGASILENQNEARVEYMLSRRWLLESSFGDAGVGGLDLLWSLRY